MKLGDVGMTVCPFCHDSMNVVIAARDGKGDLTKEMIDSEPCDKCKKLISENVSLYCHSCASVSVVTLDFMSQIIDNPEPGSKFKVFKCPHCSGDNSFTFLPPKE